MVNTGWSRMQKNSGAGPNAQTNGVRKGCTSTHAPFVIEVEGYLYRHLPATSSIGIKSLSPCGRSDLVNEKRHATVVELDFP